MYCFFWGGVILTHDILICESYGFWNTSPFKSLNHVTLKVLIVPTCSTDVQHAFSASLQNELPRIRVIHLGYQKFESWTSQLSLSIHVWNLKHPFINAWKMLGNHHFPSILNWLFGVPGGYYHIISIKAEGTRVHPALLKNWVYKSGYRSCYGWIWT